MNELVKAVDAGLDCLGKELGKKYDDIRDFVRELPAALPAPTYVTLGDDDGNSICMEWIKEKGSYLELKFSEEMYYFSFLMECPEEGAFDLAKASDLIRRFAERDEHDHDPFYGDGD